jgi:broad specificity phosphatase PhoE
VVRAVAAILDRHHHDEVVLVGHGTAWTLLRSALSGEPPDLAWWAALGLPDACRCEVGAPPGDMLAP